MEKETTSVLNVRVPQSVMGEIILEIKNTSKSLSEWLREAIDEKLTCDNRERLETEIRHHEETLCQLKKKKELFKEKERNIQKIPDTEISFLLETKRVVEQDFTFIKGRINLYKNKFGKAYRISEQEFVQLLNNAYEQYLENKAQRQLKEELQDV